MSNLFSKRRHCLVITPGLSGHRPGPPRRRGGAASHRISWIACRLACATRGRRRWTAAGRGPLIGLRARAPSFNGSRKSPPLLVTGLSDRTKGGCEEGWVEPRARSESVCGRVFQAGCASEEGRPLSPATGQVRRARRSRTNNRGEGGAAAPAAAPAAAAERGPGNANAHAPAAEAAAGVCPRTPDGRRARPG